MSLASLPLFEGKQRRKRSRGEGRWRKGLEGEEGRENAVGLCIHLRKNILVSPFTNYKTRTQMPNYELAVFILNTMESCRLCFLRHSFIFSIQMIGRLKDVHPGRLICKPINKLRSGI